MKFTSKVLRGQEKIRKYKDNSEYFTIPRF